MCSSFRRFALHVLTFPVIFPEQFPIMVVSRKFSVSREKFVGERDSAISAISFSFFFCLYRKRVYSRPRTWKIYLFYDLFIFFGVLVASLDHCAEDRLTISHASLF